MASIIGFIFFLAGGILSILKWAIIISVILNLLFAFDIINPRNQVLGRIAYGLDSFTRPFTEPLRRVIPPLGGMDFSPMIAILIIQGVQIYLLPAAHSAALGLAV